MANFVLGAGKVFFDRLVSGVYQGEKLIAETPSFAYSIKTDRAEEWTSDGPIAELAFDVATKITRSGKFVTRDISDFNLALFTIGAATTVTTTSAAVTADPINAGVALAVDTYYQLGLAAFPAVGIRKVSAVAIKTSSITHATPADYTIDLNLGRIYIPTGSACISAVCTADYTKSAASWGQVASSDTGAAEGRLRFVSDNTTGTNRDYLFPSVVLAPSGDLALKDRAKSQEMGFDLAIKKPTTGAAVYINGRPA